MGHERVHVYVKFVHICHRHKSAAYRACAVKSELALRGKKKKKKDGFFKNVTKMNKHLKTAKINKLQTRREKENIFIGDVSDNWKNVMVTW